MKSQFDSKFPALCQNLRILFDGRTDADMSFGCGWYPHAQRIMREWSKAYGVSVDTAACVTAAISPQVEWTRNLIIADDVLAQRMPSIRGCINANLDKAYRLLAQDALHAGPRWPTDLTTRMTQMFPQGPKVNSFACNLAGDNGVVTVDGHAMQAALNDVKADYRLKWNSYSVFARAYATVAVDVSLSPADFQAVIWHIWKRLYPRKAKQQLRKQWEAVGEY